MIASHLRPFLTLRALAVALLLCLPSLPARAVLTSCDASGNCGVDGTAAASAIQAAADQPDPLVINAMNTLPDAQKKWSACYADCVKKSECTASICAHQCVGSVIGAGYSSNVASQIMRYNVLGIYGASCIGDFRKYLDNVLTVARSAHNLGDISHAVINAMIDKIIDQIEFQIFSQIMNSVCQVSNEILGSVDSFVKNAICLPSATLNPFNFNLNLGRLQCDGWSVNALTGQINGTPVSGLPLNTNNLFTSGGGTVTADPVTAIQTPQLVAPVTPSGPLIQNLPAVVPGTVGQ